MKTLKSRSLAYDFVWPVSTGFPAVSWSTIAVSFSRCDWLFPPSAREVSPGNRSNYKSTRERVDSKGLYGRWRLHLIGSWLASVFWDTSIQGTLNLVPEKSSHNLCICYLCWRDTSFRGKGTIFQGPEAHSGYALALKKWLTAKFVDKF